MWRFWAALGLILLSMVYGVLSVLIFSVTSTLSGAREPLALAVFYAMGIVPGVISLIGLVVYRMGYTHMGAAVLFGLPIMLGLPALYSLAAPGPKLLVTLLILLVAAVIAVGHRYDLPKEDGA